VELFQNVQIKEAYFDSLPISKRKCDDPHYLINNKILPHCHSRLTTGSNLNKNDFRSVLCFSYILKKKVYFHICLRVNSLFHYNKDFSLKVGFNFKNPILSHKCEFKLISSVLSNSVIIQNKLGKIVLKLSRVLLTTKKLIN
jgi:hypothetical protein